MKYSIISLLAVGMVMVIVPKADSQAVPHNMTCTTPDPNHMRCVTTFEPAVSGGGKMFGPWWDADSMAPEGYKVEAASLDVGGPGAPHRCIVNLNSPMAPPDTEAARLHVAWRPGNPDTQWTGHQYGNGAWSVCYIAQRTDQRVYFRYAIQGFEGHSVFGFEKIKYTPWTFPYYYTVVNQQIAEAAQLVAVYVKIPPPAPTWPQAHKVVNGENLTTIAKAFYGNEDWLKIYKANKGKIGDADAIFPGQELIIPAP
jgi:LysM domain